MIADDDGFELKDVAEMKFTYSSGVEFKIECGNSIERRFPSPIGAKVTCSDQFNTGKRTLFTPTLHPDVPSTFQIADDISLSVSMIKTGLSWSVFSAITIDGKQVNSAVAPGKINWNRFEFDSTLEFAYAAGVDKLVHVVKCTKYTPVDELPDKEVDLKYYISGVSYSYSRLRLTSGKDGYTLLTPNQYSNVKV